METYSLEMLSTKYEKFPQKAWIAVLAVLHTGDLEIMVRVNGKEEMGYVTIPQYDGKQEKSEVVLLTSKLATKVVLVTNASGPTILVQIVGQLTQILNGARNYILKII